MASESYPVTTDPVRPLFRWLWLTVACMGATFVFSLTLLPWRLAGLPFALAGTIFGLITAFKSFTTPGAGLLKLAAPLAVFSCGFFAILLIGQAIFLNLSLEYQDCLKDALTLKTEAACKTTLHQQIMDTIFRRSS